MGLPQTMTSPGTQLTLTYASRIVCHDPLMSTAVLDGLSTPQHSGMAAFKSREGHHTTLTFGSLYVR